MNPRPATVHAATPAERSLRNRLGRTAGEHAHAALDAYRRESYETFYVEAGIALEHAMKAKLAAETPYLLAPDGRGWFQNGHRRSKGDLTSPAPRTVSAKDALERLRLLESDLVAGIATQIAETIERRDQSVHMGVFTKPTDEELLTHAAAFVEAVNGLLRQTPEEFWTDLAGLAEGLVAEERDVVRVRVLKKMADARDCLALLSEEQRDVFEDAAIEFFEDHKADHPELVVVKCPVCGKDALVAGELTDDGEPVWDHREREPVGWAPEINTVVTQFECKVCRFDLDNAEEVAAAGLPAKVANEHADPHLLYEPDDDW